MVKVLPNITIKEFQKAIFDIYSIQDDRSYSVWDILSNQERFSMRALKGIRKNNIKKIKLNLVIAVAWLMALMNRFHIDLEEQLKRRFPYLCSYCGFCPCTCGIIKTKKRTNKKSSKIRQVTTLKDFQKMFCEIYPPANRTLDHAGVHMAEEQGEISEAVHKYLGQHKKNFLHSIGNEAADYFSCVMGVANSAKIDFTIESSKLFNNNCHDCHKTPCICSFARVINFKS